MARNFQTPGIILKNNRFGEIHKGVVFLSPEQGLVDAVAYGAFSPKGKLRSVTNPLCAGILFLYRDPVKDTRKITDMDCREFFEGIRASVAKFFTASVWLETVLRTFGGDARETYDLLLRCLRLLDGGTEEEAPRLLALFLWRHLEGSGTAPDLRDCGRCGRTRKDRDVFHYLRGNPGFLCSECAHSSGALESSVPLSPGALAFLGHASSRELETAARVGLDAGSLEGLKRAMLWLAEDLAGRPLASIRAGEGIL